jgi:hypothetical protein
MLMLMLMLLLLLLLLPLLQRHASEANSMALELKGEIKQVGAAG